MSTDCAMSAFHLSGLFLLTAFMQVCVLWSLLPTQPAQDWLRAGRITQVETEQTTNDFAVVL